MRRAIVLGVLLGVLSRVEERAPGVSFGLSSDSAWIACAFVAGAGARTTSRAAVLGATALTLANGAYYAVVAWTEERALDFAGRPAAWLFAGAVGGLLFGAAGGTWSGGRPLPRAAAALALAAVLIADGAPGLTGDAPLAHGISVVLGVAFAWSSAATTRLRAAGGVVVAGLVAAGACGGLERFLP